MPEIQAKDKLITLEELGTAINAKAGVTSVNNQTGAVSITPANIGAMPRNPVSIELTPSSNAENGGYIDFHYNGSTADYTTRIIESADGVLTIQALNDNQYPILTTKNGVAKSGGTMTGPLKWASATALTAASNLQYFLGIDAFADGGTTHYITAANLLAAIGAVAVTGSRLELTVGQNITNKDSSVRKWGKSGVLNIYFEVTAQINAYATIFTATSDYKPNVEYNACVSDLNGKSYPVYYGNDGILRNRVAMPAGLYYGNLSFFVQ